MIPECYGNKNAFRLIRHWHSHKLIILERPGRHLVLYRMILEHKGFNGCYYKGKQLVLNRYIFDDSS